MDVYLDLGKTVLKDYFAYYHKHSLDDTEYIPVVKVIINGFKKTMQAAGIDKKDINKVAKELKVFNRNFYVEVWLKHAEEDNEDDNEPVDVKEETELSEHCFDYIYKHEEHPR
ncbi:MAG: hypothetical protein GY868_17390 [Deltaproteobacteria bacterium]|nr:hypothetical protein [Deltaproteobacteria bacterium]